MRSKGGDARGEGRTGGEISHEQARLLISKAWDHELTATEERILEQHLASCPQCVEAADRMKALLAMIDRALGPHPGHSRS